MLKLRGKTWQLYKRVPKRYADVEPRTFVWVSLHTDSKTAAAAKADAAWALLIEGWEARLAGASRDAEAHFDAARRLAAARSFRYIPVSEVAKLPVEDLLDFRQWWVDRIDAEGLTANSANKDLIHFGKVLKTVNRMKRLTARSRSALRAIFGK